MPNNMNNMGNINGMGGMNPNQKMDINQFISQMSNAQSRGVNPNMLINQMIQKNPNVRILQQRLANMAQGRSPQEFVIQLAKQNGATEENAQKLAKMFGMN